MGCKRIKWLDFAKGLTIFCVVLFHILAVHYNFFTYILGIFIMPVFFSISGYLYKITNTWHNFLLMLYKKLGSFLIPYVIWDLIVIIIWGRLRKITLSVNDVVFSPLYYLWFLVILFLIFLFVSLISLSHISIYTQLIMFIIIISFMSYIKIGQQRDIHLFEGYLICFYIGYLIKQFNIIYYLKNKYWCMILNFVWIIDIIISYSSIKNNDVDNFHSYDIFIKMFSIISMLSLFSIVPEKSILFKYFDKYGKYTLIIYLVHLPIIMIIAHVFKSLLIKNDLLFIIISCPSVWLISLFMCYISTKVKFINFIFYPRKYINKLLYKD